MPETAAAVPDPDLMCEGARGLITKLIGTFRTAEGSSTLRLLDSWTPYYIVLGCEPAISSSYYIQSNIQKIPLQKSLPSRFWICRALESFVRNASSRAAQVFLLRRDVLYLALDFYAAESHSIQGGAWI